MILSMTGYGKATAEYNGKKINIEVKSLNGKSMDISIRLAPLYREKEIAVRQIVSKCLVRGKVDIFIWIDKETAPENVIINRAAIANYYSQIKEISDKEGVPEPADWFATLLRLPDSTSKPEADELSEEEWAEVEKALNVALKQLNDFRIQEGIALEKMFSTKINNIKQLLESIEPHEKERVEKIKQRILDGLKNIPEAEYNSNRLEQELIYYIEKLDISEEKQRLSNHLNYFIETMNEPQSQGKKLGFIAQEMGREINTTGSKSNNAQMQNIVVMMKDELEQIKEQVLNAL